VAIDAPEHGPVLVSAVLKKRGYSAASADDRQIPAPVSEAVKLPAA
jgi:hypothetical protein